MERSTRLSLGAKNMTTNFRIAVVASLASLAVACGGPMTEEEAAQLAQSQDALKSSGGGTTSGPSYALLTTASESASPVEQGAFTINSTYNVDFAVVVTGSLSGHNSANV